MGLAQSLALSETPREGPTLPHWPPPRQYRPLAAALSSPAQAHRAHKAVSGAHHPGLLGKMYFLTQQVGMRPETLHSEGTPRRCWCQWSPDPTWEDKKNDIPEQGGEASQQGLTYDEVVRGPTVHRPHRGLSQRNRRGLGYA